MGSREVFTVDLDELDAVIADVQHTENALESLTNDLERQVAALQSVWDGLAADAQQAAHRSWEQGMADMRAALADMRTAARSSHGNYTGGANTNLEMWEFLS